MSSPAIGPSAYLVPWSAELQEALLQRAWLQAGSSSAFESDTSDGEFECKCELPTPRLEHGL